MGALAAVLLALAMTLAAAPWAEAAFYELAPAGDDIYINNDTAFASGFYNLPDTNGNGVLIINASDITLDCRGAVLNNTNTTYGIAIVTNGIGINSTGFGNVTIRGCSVVGYAIGILGNRSPSGSVYDSNNLTNNGAAIKIGESSGTRLHGNTIGLGSSVLSPRGIYVSYSSGTNISHNNISGGLFSMHWGITDFMSNGTVVERNVLINVTTGVAVTQSHGVNVSWNEISGSFLSGVSLKNCYGGTISGNAIGAPAGILATNSTRNNMTGNSLTHLALFEYVVVNVTNQSGSPLEGANVSFYNSSAGFSVFFTTNNIGIVSQRTVPRLVENLTGANYSYYPLVMNVSRPGYLTASMLVSPDSTGSYTVVLLPNATGLSGPRILVRNLSSPAVLVGGDFSIGIYANDSRLSGVWLDITYPNASHMNASLLNGGYLNFTPPVAGNYTVMFFAVDADGNVANHTASFLAAQASALNVSVLGRNLTNMSSGMTLFHASTNIVAASYNSSWGGYLSGALPDAGYDANIDAYNSNITLRLLGFGLSLNAGKAIVIERLALPGFLSVYAINSSYSFTSAVIRLRYAGMVVANESALKIKRCANWSFPGSACNSAWEDINFSLDRVQDHIESGISGFSAFGLAQGGYCGDGVCGIEENPASCSADCSCISGLTRNCSVGRSGRCASGTEACVNGNWTGCPLPSAETCNRQDDDCDGVVDDVSGGNSASSTHCQCFRNSQPGNETCNSIDDDCDGSVDESLTTRCGTEDGVCEFGTKTCLSGVWGNCAGGVSPASETCDNGLDDDCDGSVDEACPSQVACDLGPIPTTGCRCGNTTYAGGNCCFGAYQEGPCARIPWELFVLVGIAGAVAGALLHFGRGKESKKEWENLEKKYTPA